jgi:hypothetical protein
MFWFPFLSRRRDRGVFSLLLEGTE